MTPSVLAERPESAALPLWPGVDRASGDDALLGGAADPPVAHGPGASSGLDAALEEVWTALAAGFTATCLMCGGAVHPRWSAGAGVVGGRCSSCGTDMD